MVDVYYERKNNFIGPPAVATPNVFLDAGTVGAPNTLATYLARYMPPAQAQQVALLIGGSSGSSAAPGIPVGTVALDGPLSSGPDVLLTYRNFGVLDRWGTDVGARVSAGERLSFTGTYSFTTRDLFSTADIGGITDIALNAPRTKGSLGVHLTGAGSRTSASLVARHVAGFPMSSGVYVGRTDPYTLVDLYGAHRVPRADLTISLNVQNLLDRRHREFVGAPVLGRFTMLQAEYAIP
jgi:iron complex outermembrane receptor protein